MATQNIYDLVDTWNAGATTFTAIKMNVTDTASAAGSLLLDLQVGGVAKFSVTKAGVISVGTLAVSSVTGLGTGVATFLATPSSANLASAVTDETGTGALVFANTPTLVTPNIGAATGTSVNLSSRATIDTLTIGRGGATAVASNTALGYQALNSASLTGTVNVGVGYQALLANTSGAGNTAVGNAALTACTTGGDNVAVGSIAAKSVTTGGGNTAIGVASLENLSTSNYNIAIGVAAIRNRDAAANIGIGLSAAQGSATVANNTGNSLVAVGYGALASDTSGAANNAFGNDALTACTTGGTNSAFGHQSLTACTTGSNNVGIGGSAASTLTTGSRNTIIGQGTVISAVGVNDETVVGQGLTGKGADTAFVGGTNGAYNEKNVTTWETTSDERIKKNIADFNDGLAVIEALRVRTFEYRAPEEITELPQSAAIDRPGVQLGVIAQEIQQVLPACVTTNSTGVLSVSTDPLVWYLVNAVKKLSAEIKALKEQHNA